MKRVNGVVIIQLVSLMVFLAGCYRSSDVVWEDAQSAGRHMNRGLRTLGGKHGDSRQISSRDEFVGHDTGWCFVEEDQSSDYIPLSDQPNDPHLQANEMRIAQPREMPGEPGSSIPGIEAFQDPSSNSRLSSTFQNIHFPYNSSLIKGEENIAIARRIASYMKQHPNTYVFVEGHCDERGPEAYNFALGSQRSNSVRHFLANEGVNPDHVFTISYGKDRPLMYGHDEESWSQNRRAEFKVYER